MNSQRCRRAMARVAICVASDEFEACARSGIIGGLFPSSLDRVIHAIWTVRGSVGAAGQTVTGRSEARTLRIRPPSSPQRGRPDNAIRRFALQWSDDRTNQIHIHALWQSGWGRSIGVAGQRREIQTLFRVPRFESPERIEAGARAP